MARIKMSVSNEKTFAEGFEEYIIDMKSRNLRQGTIKHYQEFIQQIYKRIPQDTLISSFGADTVPAFIVALKDSENLNDVSIGTYSRDLKTLLRFFMDKEYIPHFKIKLPKADKQPIETYTDTELKKLLKKSDVKKCSFTEYRTWVIVNFLLSTGVRRNSLVNIKIKDLDFDNHVVYVNTTKNRKPLILPLNEDILKILQEYLVFRKGIEDDYLFCNIYSNQLTSSACYTAMWDYCHNRGIRQTGMHRFRHTFAKKWVLLGGSVVTLQQILGHSSLAITENYIHMLTSDLQREVERINVLNSLKMSSLKMR